MKKLILGSVCVALSSCPVGAQDDLLSLATEDSSRFVADFHAGYGDYVDLYVRVFMGQITCDYDFVESDAFNELADSLLRQLSAEAGAMIAARWEAAGMDVEESVTAYAARLLALATVDSLATSLSGRVQSEIDANSEYCTDMAETDRARLADLVAFMAANAN